MGKMIDLRGQRFGRLVAIEPTKKRSGRSIIWRCRCDCGNEPEISSNHLRDKHTQGCGCLQKQKVSEANKIHGMSRIPEYNAWRDMIRRCENPNCKSYKNYGGRGVSVCEKWHKFENFVADMGKRPEGLMLERKNNDGIYEPRNCKWATRIEQNNNQRSRRPNSCDSQKPQHWFRARHKDMMCQFTSNNQSKFAAKHKLDPGNISACLLGKAKQHKGWEFERIQKL